MHKVSIIGITGNSHSGKDTTADYLTREHGFVKIALADPIKRFGYNTFLFTEDQLWGPSQNRNHIDPRFNTDQMWDETQIRLEKHGREYLVDLLGTSDKPAIDKAYNSLCHWFFWLRREFFGKLSPRVMLQALGTEWGREAVSENLWIDYLLRTAKLLLHEAGNTKDFGYHPLHGILEDATHFLPAGVTVSDIRFPNEFARIREEGGVVFRIYREQTDLLSSNIGMANHSSENIDDTQHYDLILNNNSSISNLYLSIDTYMTMFKLTHH